ncbi:hypothetical protein FLL45_06000 [Aliikangiella marina]|uniref:Uncharacterized protein n=1 Tax=Aliikangiella marina TaxID=1712262 RepID=A0A545TJT9_9GAMM|nr:hypothetical protein [Aliikangiella marina]TQV77493.1 hypothetical protein FLL45_06000 [Aliikangiella marina]
MPQIPPISIASSNFETISRNNQPVRRDNEIAQRQPEESNVQRNRDVRLIPAITNTRNLSDIEEDLRLVRPEQSTPTASPVNQYQLNQDLLRREEIDQLVGIDFFA